MQAFHFKGGQARQERHRRASAGQQEVTEKIAQVRNLKAGQAAISPPTFPGWTGVADFRDFAAQVRERTGGIPIGFKRFFQSAVHMMQALARACGHSHLSQLDRNDLTTWKRDVACLTGVRYGGVIPPDSV